MNQERSIKNALISVFYKDGIDDIAKELEQLGVNIYSTGGTLTYLEKLNVKVNSVENLTSYPSILGGRVKTLHPKVFGGILSRRDLDADKVNLNEFEIPEFDLVIVDLYPFDETVANGGTESEIIEKIDIGGISLIRAAAKNHKDVLTISSRDQYPELLTLLQDKKGISSLNDRKSLAIKAFQISSHYDTSIYNYFNQNSFEPNLKISEDKSNALRYGENPHQKGFFYGNIEDMFTKLHGKELSYNNLLDVDAAVNLMSDFNEEENAFAILKHNNACGFSSRSSLLSSYKDALAGDPVSAFGGILIANREIDIETAEEINKLFCEVVIAPSFDSKALEILKQKKNRIVLQQNNIELEKYSIRTTLNGYLVQEKDLASEKQGDLKIVTKAAPTDSEINDLLFASKLVKHTKSNAIVLVKDKQLLASGTGQTSRVDALQQAIAKAKHFGFNLENAVMASDAFFPFPDCVEIANKEGIKSVIQPGGSIKDELSIKYCDDNKMKMVFTGIRHFKH